MCAAFYNRGCGNKGEYSLFLQFRNSECATVAHSSLNLCTGLSYVYLQRTSVWNVGINAFFKCQFLGAIQVVTAPVSCTVGTFAPVFLNYAAVDSSLFGWGFIETCEVTAQHYEVSAHSQSQGDVVIVYDTAIRAYRNIDTGFLVVFISCLANFNQRGSLSTADTLGFTGDADRTAADTYLNKVSSSLSEEQEAVAVNYVACANLNLVTIVLTNPVDGNLLPFRITFGRVNAENVSASVNQL